MRVIGMGMIAVVALGTGGCKKGKGACEDARIAAGSAWFAYNDELKQKQLGFLGADPGEQEQLDAVNKGNAEAARQVGITSEACQAAKNASADEDLPEAELRERLSVALGYAARVDGALAALGGMPGATEALSSEADPYRREMALYVSGSDAAKQPVEDLVVLARSLLEQMCGAYDVAVRTEAAIKGHFLAEERDALTAVDEKTNQREALVARGAQVVRIGELAMADGPQDALDAKVKALAPSSDALYKAAVEATKKRAAACE